MYKHFISASVLAVLLCISAGLQPVEAKTFSDNGFTADITWKERHRREVAVKGTVKGKKSCSQLNISIYFNNTNKSTANAFVETYVDNYKAKTVRNFKAADDVYATKKTKKGWFVDSIYIKCLN